MITSKCHRHPDGPFPPDAFGNQRSPETGKPSSGSSDFPHQTATWANLPMTNHLPTIDGDNFRALMTEFAADDLAGLTIRQSLGGSEGLGLRPTRRRA